MRNVIDLGNAVRAAVTERHGGVSGPPHNSLNLGLGTGDERETVFANRARAARSLGFEPDRIVWMDQHHTTDVLVATEPGVVGRCDGVVTTEPGLVLASLAADCLPVLAADTQAGALGAAHPGPPGPGRAVAAPPVEAPTHPGA